MANSGKSANEPPGGLLVGMAAAQFAIILATANLEHPSIYSETALFLSSLSLPFLLALWLTAKNSPQRKFPITAVVREFAVFVSAIGCLAVAAMILHASVVSGLVFAGAGIVACFLAYGYEKKHKAAAPAAAAPAARNKDAG